VKVERLRPGHPVARQPTGLCRSCTRLGRCQLGFADHVYEDGLFKMWVRCPESFEGGRGVAHGGWTAAALDEIGGHFGAIAVDRHEWVTVTSRLSVEYLRPIPIEQDLVLIAWAQGYKEGRWHICSELRLEAAETVLARGDGIWVERDMSHFDRADQWLETLQIRHRPNEGEEPEARSL
jgi:acyl-coenzyme A thioesterase PaaI-like protein